MFEFYKKKFLRLNIKRFKRHLIKKDYLCMRRVNFFLEYIVFTIKGETLFLITPPLITI